MLITFLQFIMDLIKYLINTKYWFIALKISILLIRIFVNNNWFLLFLIFSAFNLNQRNSTAILNHLITLSRFISLRGPRARFISNFQRDPLRRWWFRRWVRRIWFLYRWRFWSYWDWGNWLNNLLMAHRFLFLFLFIDVILF